MINSRDSGQQEQITKCKVINVREQEGQGGQAAGQVQWKEKLS